VTSEVKCDQQSWQAVDHARGSARRVAADATDEQLDRLIDQALDFTPGRGKRRRALLVRNRRGSVGHTARQAGRTVPQIAAGLGISERQLELDMALASGFEARIDGSSWFALDRDDLRRLQAARDAYVRAQRRVLALNSELLVAAGLLAVDRRGRPDFATRRSAADRVRAFIAGIDPQPAWIGSGLAPDDARRRASDLRLRHKRLHCARDAVAARYVQVVDRVLRHLKPNHRPVIQTDSPLAKLADLADEQRRTDTSQASGALRVRDDERDDRGRETDVDLSGLMAECAEMVEQIYSLTGGEDPAWPPLVTEIRRTGVTPDAARDAWWAELAALQRLIARLGADRALAA